jgi:tetratricopeptide (TPR) repeat protein
MNSQFNRQTLLHKAIIFMSLFSTISLLVGCSPSQTAATKIEPVTNDQEHNRYFLEGSGLIKPYMRLNDVQGKPADSSKVKAEIARGIALLDAVVAFNTNNWSALWIIGKGYQALGEPDKACDAFGKSYAIQRQNADVAREYMLECLNLGRTTEAVSVAEYAVSISPRDAGLYANLALAYTLAGRITDAQAIISKSLQIDPNDKISLTLRRVIQEVADGKRPQPHTMRDLQGR